MNISMKLESFWTPVELLESRGGDVYWHQNSARINSRHTSSMNPVLSWLWDSIRWLPLTGHSPQEGSWGVHGYFSRKRTYESANYLQLIDRARSYGGFTTRAPIPNSTVFKATSFVDSNGSWWVVTSIYPRRQSLPAQKAHYYPIPRYRLPISRYLRISQCEFAISFGVQVIPIRWIMICLLLHNYLSLGGEEDMYRASWTQRMIDDYGVRNLVKPPFSLNPSKLRMPILICDLVVRPESKNLTLRKLQEESLFVARSSSGTRCCMVLKNPYQHPWEYTRQASAWVIGGNISGNNANFIDLSINPTSSLRARPRSTDWWMCAYVKML